jgi:hypothetical protein
MNLTTHVQAVIHNWDKKTASDVGAMTRKKKILGKRKKHRGNLGRTRSR